MTHPLYLPSQNEIQNFYIRLRHNKTSFSPSDLISLNSWDRKPSFTIWKFDCRHELEIGFKDSLYVNSISKNYCLRVILKTPLRILMEFKMEWVIVNYQSQLIWAWGKCRDELLDELYWFDALSRTLRNDNELVELESKLSIEFYF